MPESVKLNLEELQLGSQFRLEANELAESAEAENPRLKENKTLTQDYKNAQRRILKELKKDLAALVENAATLGLDEKQKNKIQRKRNEIEDYLGKTTNFSDEKTDFACHPRLWSKTSRFTATPIHNEVEETAKKAKKPVSEKSKSSHELISEFLEGLTSENLPIITNKGDLLIHNRITAAKKQLEQLRKIQKRKYLYQLKTNTAQAIIDHLTSPNNFNDKAGVEEEDLNAIKQSLAIIRDLKSVDELGTSGEDGKSDLDTTEHVLEHHRAIRHLEKNISELHNKIQAANTQNTQRQVGENNQVTEANLEELKSLNQTFALSAKRWLDPHYKAPVQLTKRQKFRNALKLAGFVAGGVSGVGALASLVFFPPAFFPLAAIGVLGLYPLLDTTGTTIYNGAKYGRGGTRQQRTEIAVAVPAIGISVGMGNLLSHLPMLFATKLNAIKEIASGATIFEKFGFNGFAGGINTLGPAFLGWKLASDSKKVRNREQMNKRHHINEQTAKGLLLHNESTKEVMRNLHKPVEPSGAKTENNEAQKNPLYYLYKAKTGGKDKKGKDKIQLKKVESYADAIAHWSTSSLFRSTQTKTIVNLVADYKKMGSATSLGERTDKLSTIAQAIKSWKNLHGIAENSKDYSYASENGSTLKTRRTSSIKTLEDYVAKEQIAISSINGDESLAADGLQFSAVLAR